MKPLSKKQNSIVRRLSTIAGQTKGIASMIEERRSFEEVYTQLRSIQAAMIEVENLLFLHELDSDKKSLMIYRFAEKHLKASNNEISKEQK